RAATVRLRVFDVRGRLVRVLADGAYPAGLSLVAWDGRDGTGRDAATGTYFYRLEAEGVAESRKLTLLR
ncbi:MAG TPA: FlgD immunoglobulin-like domain containing protein, partial [Acidobacteriota bacterium]|nr:FlgD immunoglobulin-like domain containing protein [Acidobacteriota bacterium]